MAPRSAKEWRRHDVLVDASVRGFDHLDALPRIIPEEHAWLREFSFGFCDEEDLPSWLTMGWDHLRSADFDVESFNTAVALRFGLTDTEGVIKFGRNYVMIMPLDLYEERMDARSQAAQADFKRQVDSRRYVAPEDPRGPEFLEDYEAVKSELNINTVVPTSGQKTRGRPPKKG